MINSKKEEGKQSEGTEKRGKEQQMRTVFIVPKMFTLNELSKINSNVPEDYQQRTKEFWDYVKLRLSILRSVKKLYYDSLTKDDSEESLEFIRKDNEECYDLVQMFREKGAKLYATEDPLLLQETASWISMIKDELGGDNDVYRNDDLATEELLTKNMIDRDKYIAKTISDSLGEEEIAILFLAPTRSAGEFLTSDTRVIKIQPFDPVDYVNSWLVTLKVRTQSGKAAP